MISYWIFRTRSLLSTFRFLFILLLPFGISQQAGPIGDSSFSSKISMLPPTPAYGEDVEIWWASHPYNPESPNYIPIGGATSPEPMLDVQTQFGGDIQAAINALSAAGGTLYFAPGIYQNHFQLIGKSNVHFVSQGGVVLSGGPAQIVGCEQALDYPTIGAGVYSHDLASLACVTSNRIQNIYFKNITFDGGGMAVNALYISAAKGVVFDQVVFQNFHNPANFHHGLVDGNVNLENIWFRGVHFKGNEQWALYLDGAHFSGVVQSQIDSNFGNINVPSGGLLFMTNDDLNGDYNQDGIFEPFEKRNANYIVVAHNTFGGAGDSSMHTGIAVNGANVLIKQNMALQHMYRFALLMGKCDAINSGVDMRFNNLKVIGNTVSSIDIFTHVDGNTYDCWIKNNTMGVGKYVVRGNVIKSSQIPALIWETNLPLDLPNVSENNCVGGILYGTDIPCGTSIP